MSELREKAFKIKWHEGQYRVSLPNYDGGDVVSLADALAAVEAARREVFNQAVQAVNDERLATQRTPSLDSLKLAERIVAYLALPDDAEPADSTGSPTAYIARMIEQSRSALPPETVELEITRCPVCGYDLKRRIPTRIAMGEICSCCGTEFGVDDYEVPYSELRRRWLADGCPWFSNATPPPKGWTAQRQLAIAIERLQAERDTLAAGLKAAARTGRLKHNLMMVDDWAEVEKALVLIETETNG